MDTTPVKQVAGLYAITPSDLPLQDVLTRAELALTGGARLIQLRAKHWPRVEVERAATAMREATLRHRARLIINDDVELAIRVAADGVHLGRTDASLDGLWRIARPGFLIGVSCYNDLARARLAQEAGAGYVAFGSVFPSRTKPDAVQAPLELFRTARAALRIPIVAIGGITPENAGRVAAAGADAVAAISGLFGSKDVLAAARSYVRAIRCKTENCGEMHEHSA